MTPQTAQSAAAQQTARATARATARVTARATARRRSRAHRLRTGAAALTAGMLAAGAAGPLAADPAPSRYRPPIAPVSVVAPFDPQAREYGPGHRGVDLLAPQGTTVRAAAGGVVTFAGQVAGREAVVVAHPDGIRTTYEPVHPSVAAGHVVAPGEALGTVNGRHGDRDDVLHWGARRGDAYLDPLSLLRRLGVVRLVPRR